MLSEDVVFCNVIEGPDLSVMRCSPSETEYNVIRKDIYNTPLAHSFTPAQVKIDDNFSAEIDEGAYQAFIDQKLFNNKLLEYIKSEDDTAAYNNTGSAISRQLNTDNFVFALALHDYPATKLSCKKMKLIIQNIQKSCGKNERILHSPFNRQYKNGAIIFRNASLNFKNKLSNLIKRGCLLDNLNFSIIQEHSLSHYLKVRLINVPLLISVEKIFSKLATCNPGLNTLFWFNFRTFYLGKPPAREYVVTVKVDYASFLDIDQKFLFKLRYGNEFIKVEVPIASRRKMEKLSLLGSLTSTDRMY